MAKINYEIMESDIVEENKKINIDNSYLRQPSLSGVKIGLLIKIKNPKLIIYGSYNIDDYILNYKNKMKCGFYRRIRLIEYKKHNERWQNLKMDHTVKEMLDFKSSLDKKVKILIDNYFIKALQEDLEKQESLVILCRTDLYKLENSFNALKDELKKVPAKKIEELSTRTMSEIIMNRPKNENI